MTRQSKYPEIIDALVAAFTRATEGKAKVYDGPPVSTEDDYVCVGHNGGDESPVSNLSYSYKVSGRADEDFDVSCQLSVEGGDRDYSKLRRVAFDILDALLDVLVEDPRLGGLLAKAEIAQASIVLGDDTAASLTINFTVVCEGTRTRGR